MEGSLSATGNPYKTWNQLPVDTLESALLSTQVSSGFVVERSASLRDTITFLQTINRQISSRATSITARHHDDNDDDGDEEEDEEQAITTGTKPLWEIKRWSERMSKSGNLTTTDVFAKQLMQVRAYLSFVGAELTP